MLMAPPWWAKQSRITQLRMVGSEVLIRMPPPLPVSRQPLMMVRLAVTPPTLGTEAWWSRATLTDFARSWRTYSAT